jgi:L-lactate dehydrogenase complex protein LldF
MSIPSPAFHKRIHEGLSNAFLQEALRRATKTAVASRDKAFSILPGAEEVRDRARAIRAHTIANLDHYLELFAREVERRGGKVFWASTAQEACTYVVNLARARGVSLIAKSKSMVSEEVGLNHALEAAGIRVVETDLGEFIIQLAGERPSHITAPAIHKRREDVSELFQKHLGMPPTLEIPVMTATARQALRQIFLDANMGISGVNFGIAETGTLVLVTNEGNGRMVTTLPPIHVALMGIERVVPTWEDTEILLRLIARSASGLPLTAYVSFLTGPRRPEEPDGPEELHVVLVDNGRSRWLGTPMEEALYCIRCGACLNACPVYQAIGGHAYNSVYPGPIGALVTPMLWGEAGIELVYASSLCGACQEICPVRISTPDLLVRWRKDSSHLLPAWERAGLWIYALIARNPRVWELLGRLGTGLLRRLGRDGWMRRGIGPLQAWTSVRDLPLPQRPAFRDWWKSRNGGAR